MRLIFPIVAAAATFFVIYFLLHRKQAAKRHAASGRDRRAFVRVAPPPDLPIRIELIGNNLPKDIEIVDISEGGVGLRVLRELRGVGALVEVTMEIELPGMSPFDCRGIVRHIKRSKKGSAFCGVEFTFISIQDRNRIVEYIHGIIRHRLTHFE